MTTHPAPADRWPDGTAPAPAARFDDLFPDGAGRSTGRWSPRRPAVIAVAVLAVVLVAVVVAVRVSGASTTAYRTATAQVHDVEARFESVVTLEPTSQAAVGFPTDGTVATVDVAVGDSVVVGQALASLDVASLEQGVRSAQAALDQAELTLARALAGEDVSSVGGAGGPSGSTSSSGGAVTPISGTTSSSARTQTTAATQGGEADPGLGQAQQAVLQAQQQASAALRRAETALASAQAICAGTSTDPATTTEAAATDSQDGTGQSDGDQLDACQAALTQVLAAQTEVSAAQTALADASVAYDALLDERAADQGSSGQPADGATGGATSPDQSSGATTPTTSAPSSEQLIACQKAVDAAALDVAVAEQALSQATIASPIDGTVVAVGLRVGESVTAGASGSTITVQGPGGYEATTTVGVDDIAQLAVGQAATVLVDGKADPISGQVTSIALSDAAEATYLVVIGLQGDTTGIRNGATGTAAITLDAATGALAVPTSAVTITGATGTVDVVTGGTAVTTNVTVGVIGDTWTQILRGIDEGDEVVLADLTEPLPGTATETGTTGGLPTIRGGLPGGGAFPGGGGGAFPGGGGFPGRPGG